MKEILIPLNFTTTPVLYDTKQSFSASDEESGVLTFTTTADVTGTVASLTIRNASENANRQTVIVDRLDVNSSPFSYAVKMPLPFGQYEGTVLLKKNLTVLASATFLFGVNSSLSAEVLPKLVETYSLDNLVEEVETEVSNLKDAYTVTVSETVKGVNQTESKLQASENVRYLNEDTRKNNNSLWKAQAEAFALAEENRVIEFNDLVDSAVIEQTVTQEVANEFQQIEATYANRLLSNEQQLADIDSQVDLINRGLGETFATLVALQTAYPTGDTKDHIVGADGHRYFWNDTAWVDGGAYQAIEILDGAVTPKKTTFVIVSPNMFDPSKVTTGYNMAQTFNVSTTTDKVVEATSAVTPVFEIGTQRTFITDIIVKLVTYYNASGLRQGGLAPSAVSGKYTFTIPANMKYFIVTGWNDDTYAAKGVYEGSAWPATTQLFGTKLDPNIKASTDNFKSDDVNYNVSLGHYALTKVTPGAVIFDDGKYNTALGHSALRLNTLGDHNAAVGYGALMNNTIGNFLTAMGEDALMNNTSGDQSSAFGNYALKANTIGSRNTVVGNLALSLNVDGSYNVAVGDHIGMENYGVGDSSISDDFMTFIGSMSGVDKSVNTGDFTNSTAIGANSFVDKSNVMQLGDANITEVRTHGDFEAQDIGNGFVCKSPNGNRWRITVSDTGQFVSTAL